MKELRSFKTTMEAHFAAGRLEAQGITCEVRENSTGEGGGPRTAIWILRDSDLPAAIGVLDRKPENALKPWSCPGCKQPNDALFDACWSCGGTRA
jgi:hypothetical protein